MGAGQQDGSAPLDALGWDGDLLRNKLGPCHPGWQLPELPVQGDPSSVSSDRDPEAHGRKLGLLFAHWLPSC